MLTYTCGKSNTLNSTNVKRILRYKLVPLLKCRLWSPQKKCMLGKDFKITISFKKILCIKINILLWTTNQETEQAILPYFTFEVYKYIFDAFHSGQIMHLQQKLKINILIKPYLIYSFITPRTEVNIFWLPC